MTTKEIVSKHSRKTGIHTFRNWELEFISNNTRYYGEKIPEWVRRVMRRRGVYVPAELGTAIRKRVPRRRESISERSK